MAGLLVSVRSAVEARAAVAGGASVIDVKDPERGPLGRAEVSVWSEVRSEVPPRLPVSVALGEWHEWFTAEPTPGSAWEGITYRKLGWSGAPSDWAARWNSLNKPGVEGPPWVAVAYADWETAHAPHPHSIIEAALGSPRCAGVLFDTWDKTRPSPLDATWRVEIERVQSTGRLVALAGGLDVAAIRRLGPALRPDLFAVRGAACADGVRCGMVQVSRVQRLTEAARCV